MTRKAYLPYIPFLLWAAVSSSQASATNIEATNDFVVQRMLAQNDEQAAAKRLGIDIEEYRKLETAVVGYSQKAKREAAEKLIPIKSEAAIPLLIPLLAYRDDHVKNVIKALQGLDREKVIPYIEKAFESNLSVQHRGAIKACGLFKVESKIPEILANLLSKDINTRDAVYAACKMFDPEVVKKYVAKALASDDNDKRRGAIHYIGVKYYCDFADKLDEIMSNGKNDALVRNSAIQNRLNLANKRKCALKPDFDLYARLLADPDEKVARYAHFILMGKCKHYRAEVRDAPLGAVLKGLGDDKTRMASLKFLAELWPDKKGKFLSGKSLENVDSLTLLERFALHRKAEVCQPATIALGKLGQKALPSLEKVFEKNHQARKQVLIAAAEIGEPALGLFEKALSEGDFVIREFAAETLVSVGPSALGLIQRALNDSNRGVRAKVLASAGKLGEPALPILKSAYENKDAGIREEAIKACKGVGKPALDILFTALDDENVYICQRAGSAIAEIGGPKEVKRLARLLDKERTGTHAIINALDKLDAKWWKKPYVKRRVKNRAKSIVQLHKIIKEVDRKRERFDFLSAFLEGNDLLIQGIRASNSGNRSTANRVSKEANRLLEKAKRIKAKEFPSAGEKQIDRWIAWRKKIINRCKRQIKKLKSKGWEEYATELLEKHKINVKI